MKEALMVDKITSWKFVEEFSDETPAMHKARIRAEEIGVECITAATGAQLAFTVASLGAKAIVEVGTGTGLSGLWLLHGSPEATLATIDTETEHQAAARLSKLPLAMRQAIIKTLRIKYIIQARSTPAMYPARLVNQQAKATFKQVL
jgi:predicted O-methyltransferase YrrM